MSMPLATDPSMRGKGYGRQLLHYVDGFLSSRGSDCVTVVPAEPSLHKFFATVAFCPAFSTRKLELLRDMVGPARAEDGLTEAEPQEYGRPGGAPCSRIPPRSIMISACCGSSRA